MRRLVLTTIGAFSLAAASLRAQAPLVLRSSYPDLFAVAVPDRLDARVSNVTPHALVGFVLGVQPDNQVLPGGAALGMAPITVAALAFADAAGVATASLHYTPGHAAGADVLVQAIAYDTNLALGTPGALVTTPLRKVHVPLPGQNIDLVVLFGQSNAEGAARLSDLPLERRGPHPHVRIWNDAMNAWQPVEAGVNNMLVPGTPTVGPELGFADAMRPHARPLWLVKCAVWQSSLGPTPGPLNEWGPSAAELYPEMLRRIDAAVAGATALGLVPQIRLICMMQGEADALLPTLATSYAVNLDHLVTQLRADLSNRGLCSANQPFFRIGMIAPALAEVGFVATEVVRAAQRTVAANQANCDLVETRPMAVMADRVHFALAGLRDLGRAFVQGFVER